MMDEEKDISEANDPQEILYELVSLSDSENEEKVESEASNFHLMEDDRIHENDGQAPCSSKQASRQQNHSSEPANSPGFFERCVERKKPSFSLQRRTLSSSSSSSSSSPSPKRRAQSVPNTSAFSTLRQVLLDQAEDFSESSEDEGAHPTFPDSTSGEDAHEIITPEKKKRKKDKGKSLLHRRKKRFKRDRITNLHSTHAYPHLPETTDAVDLNLLPGGLYQRMIPEPYVQETIHLYDIRSPLYPTQRKSFPERMELYGEEKDTCPPVAELVDRGMLNATSNFLPMVLPGFAKHRQGLHYKGRKYGIPNSYRVRDAVDPHDRHQRNRVRETAPAAFCDEFPLPTRSSTDYSSLESSNPRDSRCCRADPIEIKTREYLGENRTKTKFVCPTNHGPKRLQYVSSFDLKQRTKEQNDLIVSFEVVFFKKRNLLQSHVDILHHTIKQCRRKRPPATKMDYVAKNTYLEVGAIVSHSSLQRTHDFLRLRSEDGRKNVFEDEGMDTDIREHSDTDEDQPSSHRRLKAEFIKRKNGSRIGKIGLGPAVPNFSQAHRVGDKEY